MSIIISLKKVKKQIGKEEILKDITLEIKKGEFVSIVGVSGSGKSSLLYIMGFLDKPSTGEVFFEGKKINYRNEEELSTIRNLKMGFIFQFHYLLPEFSALENVMAPMLKKGIPIPEAIVKSRKILKKVGLEGKEHRKPYQLSGGEQQRVAVARALANDPSVILADEPTGNLDSRNTEEVMNIFESINREGRTIIMVTHELYLAKRARRILRMKDGRVEEL